MCQFTHCTGKVEVGTTYRFVHDDLHISTSNNTSMLPDYRGDLCNLIC